MREERRGEERTSLDCTPDGRIVVGPVIALVDAISAAGERANAVGSTGVEIVLRASEDAAESCKSDDCAEHDDVC